MRFDSMELLLLPPLGNKDRQTDRQADGQTNSLSLGFIVTLLMME